MDIKAALLQYNAAMDKLETAEQEVQTALAAIKATSGSSTVSVEGQFFQVRERKDKLYLCELTGKPRGRPKGSKNRKPRSDSKKALAAAAALAAVDGVTSDVVDGVTDDVAGAVAFAQHVSDLPPASDSERVPETTGIFAVDHVVAVEMLDSIPAEQVG